MYSYVDEIQHFNYKRDYLTLQRNDVLLVPLVPHLWCNDFLFAIFLVMFPKVVDDPQVDEKFQEDEATYYHSWDHLKTLEQEVVVFLDVVLVKYLNLFVAFIHAELVKDGLFPTKHVETYSKGCDDTKDDRPFHNPDFYAPSP